MWNLIAFFLLQAALANPAPALTADDPVTSGGRVVFKGTCSQVGRLMLGGAGEGTVFCNRGRWEFSTPKKHGASVYTLTALDGSGKEMTLTLAFETKNYELANAD